MSDTNHAASEHALSAGSILNENYIIEQVLGEGGFGITYSGTCLSTNKQVAIKEYFPSGVATRTQQNGKIRVSHFEGKLADSFQKGLQRFLNEANLLREFHDLGSIVSVFDVFEENGTAYIVMEYIEGITLKQLICNEGTLPFDEMISLFKPVLLDLHEVHKKGLIHRDISPDNLIVGMDNQLHLIDFGAASFKNPNESKTMTVILKSGYAPPEQYISDGKIGPWTDVYALCATMYMVLNVEKPVDAIRRMQGDTLDFIDGHSSLEDYQKKAILQGLQLNYAERFSSTKLLYQALTTTPTEESAKTLESVRIPQKMEEQIKDLENNPSVRLKPKRRNILIFAALCVVIGLSIWQITRLNTSLEGENGTQDNTQNETSTQDDTESNNASSGDVTLSCDVDYIELTIGEEITYDNQLQLNYTISGDYPSTAITITETYPNDLLFTGSATDPIGSTYYATVYPYREYGEGTLRTSLLNPDTGEVYATHSIPVKVNPPTDGIYPDFNNEILTMIDTKGMTLENAKNALTLLDGNIEITVVEEYHSEVSAGLVISQSIMADTQFSYGQISQIQLVVSKGPAPKQNSSNNSYQNTQPKDDGYTTIHLE